MTVRPSAVALTPLLLFLALFFGAGLYFTAQGEPMGFYQLRAPVAILPALALAAWIAHRRGLQAGDILLQGMGDPSIVLMCLIFLLAGAFAYVSSAIGAVEAVVSIGLSAIPAPLILPGLFLLSGLISLAIGSSMGTIAAVVPIALGVAQASGLEHALVVGAVIGGAMFGDNLSVISDTTIAATRTQGAQMRDKFRENFRIAVPAALATMGLLGVLGGASPIDAEPSGSAWLVLPYVIVLALALSGVNVLIVLGVGIVLAGAFGLAFADDYGVVPFVGDIWSGFEGMIEILLLSLLIGGLGALTKASGGLDWLAQRIATFARGQRGRRSGVQHRRALHRGRRVHRQQHRRDPRQRQCRPRYRRETWHQPTACRECARHLRLRRTGRAALRRADPAGCFAGVGVTARARRQRALLLAAGCGGDRFHAVAGAQGCRRPRGADDTELVRPLQGPKTQKAPGAGAFCVVQRC